MHSPTPITFSPKGRPKAPWTFISLTLAVSWMLLLAFGPQAPSSPKTLGPESSLIYKTVEVGFLTGMYIAAHHVIPRDDGRYADTLAQAPDSDG